MVAVYTVIRRSTGRTEAIKAAAKITLDEAGQQLVEALLIFLQSVEGQRNDLAHGHWGVSPAIPEGILWLDGSYTIDFHIKHRQTVIIEGTVLPVDIQSNLFYYTIKDLDEIRKLIGDVCEALFTLRTYIDSFRDESQYRTNEEVQTRLNTYAHIRQALARINGDANPPTPPKLHG